ncbi:hypothetical protein TraAM80_07998 [Trypanosoma rangeli]|uniref:Uncharacterized protein n=1 Tax=Trypanosoma rangeli TaxID=5698 RepID=A0A422N2U6_TRYRA|nr:uncharacterized protein TraAM80_07998 [Trypanosoma rangeli]RNE99806.1 hypothetical protein TraAM80_07998 [Trypanosoma rangeli]|eukprot:RNE99806.1 hypothetical protein TraAM80_07998 [Trypanosoma rangeli]
MLRHIDWDPQQRRWRQQEPSLPSSPRGHQQALEGGRTPPPRREAPPPPLGFTAAFVSPSHSAALRSVSSPLPQAASPPGSPHESLFGCLGSVNDGRSVLHDTISNQCCHADSVLMWRQEALRKERELTEREEEFHALVQMQHAACQERLEEISRKEKCLLEWEQRLRFAEKPTQTEKQEQ